MHSMHSRSSPQRKQALKEAAPYRKKAKTPETSQGVNSRERLPKLGVDRLRRAPALVQAGGRSSLDRRLATTKK